MRIFFIYLLAVSLIIAPFGVVEAAAKKKSITTTNQTCDIKGNISSDKKKEKIYHVPGCASYKATIIEASKGERMFCSEKEAKDAGWRKALNCPK